ncbi:hypothetical protein Ssi02_60030 [Sinosporangium siamense]|uniref:Uncharacterized protein n=1 Tax=Sinosporangium siamense TaxID=1367973 RepID=A0A919RM80_9ACTN|nr:hypothetical protein Ssi02_60030 [Sinosporangium siamense]
MMTVLPLIIAALLGFALLVGYVAVLIGIRREDKAMSLSHAPTNVAASLARRVTGCHVRNDAPTSAAATAPLRPSRVVPTVPVRRREAH